MPGPPIQLEASGGSMSEELPHHGQSRLMGPPTPGLKESACYQGFDRLNG
jgi:hypothetical protein